MEQNRFKSPILWSAIVAQVIAILVLAGAFDQVLGETIKAIVAGVLQLLVILGILNNPTDKVNW